REYDITLDFLEKGNYEAEIYADAPDSDQSPKHITIKKVKVKAGAKINLRLAPAGGAAIQFRKLN
ncbi:MAG: glycoside hydrolase family 97 C-terminal domain-containing protein, partial [Tannerellaceae bacterium]|nr:glycoside hydrolase family 97 C-terminal domain-containing protein [Tannerellaceae bacterium]